jgi:hypothetical protein
VARENARKKRKTGQEPPNHATTGP